MKRPRLAPCILLLATLWLAACGGGGGGGETTAPHPESGSDWDRMHWDSGRWA